jgi:hypothetical protein
LVRQGSHDGTGDDPFVGGSPPQDLPLNAVALLHRKHA